MVSRVGTSKIGAAFAEVGLTDIGISQAKKQTNCGIATGIETYFCRK
jgi:hypothetical protein